MIPVIAVVLMTIWVIDTLRKSDPEGKVKDQAVDHVATFIDKMFRK